jgi:ADP-ribose pyrophosphatase YjhB (NUDIX family)
MYEVFFNDRKIIVTAPGNIGFNKTSVIMDGFQTKEAVGKWFLEFSKNNISNVFLIHNRPEYFFENLFRPAFEVIQAAGGVVKRENTILFIFRNNKWDLPKGKIDRGEMAKEASVREVEEECGITGHEIIKEIPSTFHIYQSPYTDTKGEWILKETFWFEMNYFGGENGHPQLAENISEVKWMKQNELRSVLENTYENLKQMILNYLIE